MICDIPYIRCALPCVLCVVPFVLCVLHCQLGILPCALCFLLCAPLSSSSHLPVCHGDTRTSTQSSKVAVEEDVAGGEPS